MNEKIDVIIYNLNLIDTHGAENLSRLLGCIQELEKLKEVSADAGHTND